MITSRKNPIIKEAASLINSAEKRRATSSFIVEGARLIRDAALSGTKIFRLFYTESSYGKYKIYIDEATKKADEAYVIEEHIADLLSSTKSTQGIFAVCSMNRESISEIKGKILVLENIQDPSNIGGIFRTAEALGIGTLLLCGECCDIYSPKVLRGSMGAIFRMNFVLVDSASSLKKLLCKHDYKLFGAVPDSDAVKITDLIYNEKTAVAVGNEGNGLTDELKNLCDSLITIPMLGRAESLNAATAAAIIMWEMIK